MTLDRTYDPAAALISEEQAIQRASAVLEQNDPSLLSGIRSIRLRFSVLLRGFGNAEFGAENSARHVYYIDAVRFDRCVVHISARNGKCHGGLRITPR